MIAELFGWIIEWVIEGFGQFVYDSAPRFFVCALLAVAVDVFILWLVPATPVIIILAIGVVLIGVAGGVMWERQSKA